MASSLNSIILPGYLTSFQETPNGSLSSSLVSIDLTQRSQLLPGHHKGLVLTSSSWNAKTPVLAHASICVSRSMRWWEKTLQPNMIEISSAQELVHTLSNSGDRLVILQFYSPGCGGCKALHPKICQLAESNPKAIFLQVNYEELKPICQSLHIPVLPFFRFYKGHEGKICSFSCTVATPRFQCGNKWGPPMKNKSNVKDFVDMTHGDKDKPILLLIGQFPIPKPQPHDHHTNPYYKRMNEHTLLISPTPLHLHLLLSPESMAAVTQASVAAFRPCSRTRFLTGSSGKLNRELSVKPVGTYSSGSFKVEAKKGEWLPGLASPGYLNGSLPGDNGFDPLGLAEDPENLKWFVQAELVNGRWAMLGVAGMLLPEVFTSIGILNVPKWYDAGKSEYFASSSTLFVIEFILFHYVEIRRWQDIKNPGSVNQDPIFKSYSLPPNEVGYPGGIFNPLNFAPTAEAKEKELANGRLAMLAFLGFIVQHNVTGKGPFDNLLQHLSDPWHNTIVQTLSGN